MVSSTDGGEDEDGGDVPGDEFRDARSRILVGVHLGDALEGVRGALFDGDDLNAGGAGGVGVGSRAERGGARGRGGRVAALEPALLGGGGCVRVRHGRGVAVRRAGDERGGAANGGRGGGGGWRGESCVGEWSSRRDGKGRGWRGGDEGTLVAAEGRGGWRRPGWKTRGERGGARRRTGRGGRTHGVARRWRTRGARGRRRDRRARSRRTWRAACRGARASAGRRSKRITLSRAHSFVARGACPTRVLTGSPGVAQGAAKYGVESSDGARHKSPRALPSSATCLPPRVARSFAPWPPQRPPRRARVLPSWMLPATVPTGRLGFSPSRRARPSRHPERSPPPRELTLWVSR